MRFNLGKFNIKSINTSNIYGTADVDVRCSALRSLLIKQSEKLDGYMSVIASCSAISAIYSEKAISEIDLKAATKIAVITDAGKLNADFEVDAQAIGSILGEKYILLSGVKLKKGQTLEIDSEAMTITIDGENAMHLLNYDSGDFFDLLAGDNHIEAVFKGRSSIEMSCSWKDRWL